MKEIILRAEISNMMAEMGVNEFTKTLFRSSHAVARLGDNGDLTVDVIDKKEPNYPRFVRTCDDKEVVALHNLLAEAHAAHVAYEKADPFVAYTSIFGVKTPIRRSGFSRAIRMAARDGMKFVIMKK